MTRPAPVQMVVNWAGGVRPLARLLSIDHSAVLRWKAVPERWAHGLADAMGVPVDRLRPDIDAVQARMDQQAIIAVRHQSERRVVRAIRAARAAQCVVGQHVGRDRSTLRTLRGAPRQMAVYLACTAVEDVCRVTVGEYFLVTHQAVSKALAALGDARGDDEALDGLLDALGARVAALVDRVPA